MFRHRRACAVRGQLRENSMNKKTIAGVMMVALLSACGGGGGSDGLPPPSETFNMDAALANVLSVGVNFTGLRATVEGNTFELSVSFYPTTDGPFLSQIHKRSIQTGSASVNGVGPVVTTQTIFYSLNPVQFVGAIDDMGLVTTFATTGNLPTSASVGQSGPFSQAVTYLSATDQTRVGETIVTWSLEPETPTTAWACLVMTAAGGASLSEKDCYLIDRAGNISAGMAVITVEGQTLVFR